MANVSVIQAERDDLPFFKYQKAMYLYGLERILSGENVAFLVGMGLGKTRPAAAIAADLYYQYKLSGPIIVLGPKRVIEDTWPDELQKWVYTRELTFEVLNGTEEQILAKMAKKGVDIHLCSLDRAHILLKSRKLPRYGMAILDEGQKLRNQATRRWQSADLATSFAEVMLLLTGTPAPNGLHQLWAPMFLLDRGKRLGRKVSAFLAKFFNVDKISKTVRPRRGTKEAIYRRLRDMCFTLMEEDYQNLPELKVIDVPLKLTPSLEKKYKDFEMKSVLDLPELNEKITAFSASALSQKLTQFANGAVYDLEKKWHKVHDFKVDALADIVEEAWGENVLVIYQHKSDLARILARFPQAVHLDKKKSIDDWKAGRIQMAVGHPASIGVGLNLQSGGHIMVWFGLTWNLEDYLQTIKRLHRTGQDQPVIMYRLFCVGTIDEKLIKTLLYKDANQREFMLSMKHDIKQILRRAA